jgi:hypothetical protein
MKNLGSLLYSEELLVGLIGAIVGGLITYWASIRLEKNKTEDLFRRLHCLLIMEVWGHQTTLTLVVDRILPAWLLRGEATIWGIGAPPLAITYERLKVSHFERFLDQLAYSPLLVQAANYYSAVAALNGNSAYVESLKEKQEGDIRDYVRYCYEVLEASIYFLDDLFATPGIQRYFTPLLTNISADFSEQRAWRLGIAVLAKFRYKHLREWVKKMEEGSPVERMPEILQDRASFILGYLEAADSLPRGRRF